MAITAAQLLDELMGKDRNLVPGEQSSKVHWSHADTCKSFLCGFCPSDLFTNTKADLGPCLKVHDDQHKLDYETDEDYGRKGYEEEFVHYLGNIQAEVERKIRRGHERLLMNKARDQEMAANDNDKVKMLTDHINQLLQEIEELGSEGKVEEAQGVAKLVEQLKEEREQHKQNPIAGQEKQMEVCEVCGAFLIVGDAQSRVDDHLQGKQHMGYAKIKTTLEEFKERPWTKKRNSKKEEVDSSSKDRDHSRERKRGSRTRSRERRKSRETVREKTDEKRQERRDKSRERRDKSRERSRDRRDKSRERSRRSERERRRSRDRDSKRRSHRSRSRESRRRRSKERRRSKDERSSQRSRSKERNGSKDEKIEESRNGGINDVTSESVEISVEDY